MKYCSLLILIGLFVLQLGGYGQSVHCLTDRYAQDTLFAESDIQITQDLEYGVAVSWNDTTHHLLLDVYEPIPSIDPVESRPLILMTHGGSFATGNKEAMSFYAMHMAQRGFVVASINYRLGWNCNVATENPCVSCTAEAGKLVEAVYRAVQDHRAALRYLVHNASEFGIDTGFVFLQGESAGAITSLSSAFWSQSEAEAFCPTCVNQIGLLDTSGNSLTEQFSIKGVINSCGGIPQLNQGVVDGQNIPVIGFHSEWDCVVPYLSGPVINCLPVTCGAFFWINGSNSLYGRLNQNGVCTQMNRVLANFLHCSGTPAGAIVGKSTCFLKNILCETCTTSVSNQTWDIPDCTAGLTVDIHQTDEPMWAVLKGNRIDFDQHVSVTSVRLYDLSMRIIQEIPVSYGQSCLLPSNLTGCFLVKVDSKGDGSQVVKWSNTDY